MLGQYALITADFTITKQVKTTDTLTTFALLQAAVTATKRLQSAECSGHKQRR